MFRIKDWNIEAMTGYKPKTTFYMDFSIADKFGEKAIKDTYNRGFKAWKEDVEYITELCMVLNWKVWEHYKTNAVYANLYNSLWGKLNTWCLENLKGDELKYFLRTTD